MEVRHRLSEGAIVGKGKKTVKDHVDTVVEQMPDAAELREFKDQLLQKMPERDEWLAWRDELIEKLPDKSELLDLRDGLIDKLPDDVSEKLPVETPKKKRFRRVRKLALVGAVTAGVAAVAAFVRARMADEPTYTASTYTPPAGSSASTPPPA